MSLLRRFFQIAAISIYIAIPVSFPSGGPALASQLLANGGLEEGTLDPWRSSGDLVTLSRVSSQKRTGAYSAALTSGSLTDKWMYQSVPVTGGNSYSLSVYVLKNDPQTDSVYLRIYWYTSSDGTGQATALSTSEYLTGDSPEFRFLALTAEAPLDARSARVLGALRPSSSDAVTAYFDDFSLEGEVSTPTPAVTPTATATPTLFPTATPTVPPTATRTATPLPTATHTPVPTATSTATSTATASPSPSPTNTSVQGATPTSSPVADASPTATPDAGGALSLGQGRVLISEVLVDPTTDPEAAGEWVELFNAGDETVDLEGWTLADNQLAIQLPGDLLAPRSYLVVVADTFGFFESHPLFSGTVVQSPAGRIGNGLSNEADMVLLKDASGQAVDSVNWGKPQASWPNYHTGLWDPGLSHASQGLSLARADGRESTFSAGAWMVSQRPSPGLPAFPPDATATPNPTATPVALVSPAPAPTVQSIQTPGPLAIATPAPTPAIAPPGPSQPPAQPGKGTAVPVSAPPGAPSVGSNLTGTLPAAPGGTASPTTAQVPAPSAAPVSPTLAASAPVPAAARVSPDQGVPTRTLAGEPPPKIAVPSRSVGFDDVLVLLFIAVPAGGLILLLKQRFFS